ncbi:MAG: cache domain-containing protein, partial [candidate division Zixibacteria bacterium]|nr:cache domain-containing protein [candidate division Zixibacteria bacterium]
MKITFRTAQLMGYTLVVALMGAFTLYAGFSFISETVVKEAKLRVEMDLNSAWHSYDDEKAFIEMAVSMATQHESLRGVLRGRADIADMIPQMRALADKYGLHFLTLVDKNGIVLARLDETGVLGQRVRRDPVIDRALQGTAAKGTALVSPSDLLREGAELAHTAYIPLVPTERARPTERLVEDRGMVVEAAVPILTVTDSVLGVFYGGKLLNRKFRLVDRVRNAVFGDNIYQGKPLGTVTIFLQDVRIATNVIKADSTRAIGTRVSDEVYVKVLERGERFADRAFVVNDWYLSAYDPIKDPDGNIIGILYVGLLEKKYLDYKSSLVMRFLEITFLALLLSVVLCFFLSATIRRPVLRLVEATRSLSAGRLDARVSGTST